MSTVTRDQPITPVPGASGEHRTVAQPQPWHRPTVNITPIERAGRVLIGLAAALAGVALLAAAGSLLAVVLEVLLVAAGLDLVVTGALGHCPLYHKLGYVPTPLRSRV